MSKKNFGVLAAVSVCAALLAGCDRQKPSVVQYDIPKSPRAEGVAETAPPAPAAPVSAPTPAPGGMTASAGLVAQTTGIATPSWTVPPGWKVLEASAVRKGSWMAGAAQVAVTAFPGNIDHLGGMQANVARWATQLHMPAPASPDDYGKLLETGKIGGIDATRVALSHNGEALTTVIVEQDGAVWFFKISGSAAAVEAADADFNRFLSSVKFSAAK